MYKPTCAGYIYLSLKVLNAYLEEYKLDNAEIGISNDIKISICHGITDDDNVKHKFISLVEPEYTCYPCKNTFCEYCMYTATGKSDENTCIKCKKNPSSVDDLPAESETRRMLADAGVHLNNNASYSTVV